eukprot:4639328-Pyramimonas_sp.AAC.1
MCPPIFSRVAGWGCGEGSACPLLTGQLQGQWHSVCMAGGRHDPSVRPYYLICCFGSASPAHIPVICSRQPRGSSVDALCIIPPALPSGAAVAVASASPEG